MTDELQETPEETEGAQEESTEAEEVQEQAATPATEEPAEKEDEDDGLDDEDREYSERVQRRISQKTKQQREAERRADYWEKEAKRLAQERETRPREPSPAKEQEPKPAPDKPPQEADFDSYEDYIEAKATYAAKQTFIQERMAMEAAQKEREFRARMDEAAKRIPDFAEKVYKPYEHGGPMITPAMYEATLESELAGDIAYYLASHTDEARKIAGLSERAQAREIGKIEAKLEAGTITVTPPRTTNAPPPIPQKVGSANKGGKTHPDDLPIGEWMEKSKKGELRY